MQAGQDLLVTLDPRELRDKRVTMVSLVGQGETEREDETDSPGGRAGQRLPLFSSLLDKKENLELSK